MLFELTELRLEVGLVLVDLLRLLTTVRRRRAGVGQITHVVGNLGLLAGELVGLPLPVLDVALRTARLVLLEAALRLLQPFERGLRLRRRIGVAAGSGFTHRVGCLLHLARGFLQVGAVLFACEALEPACGLFGLLRERALLRRGAA